MHWGTGAGGRERDGGGGGEFLLMARADRPTDRAGSDPSLLSFYLTRTVPGLQLCAAADADADADACSLLATLRGNG